MLQNLYSNCFNGYQDDVRLEPLFDQVLQAGRESELLDVGYL